MLTSKMDLVVRKTRRYWYEDGFVEIGAGILLSLVAVWLAGKNAMPQTSSWFDIVNSGLPLFIIVLGLAGSVWIRNLKERVTYARSGYVAFDRNGRWRGWFAVVIASGIGLPILMGYIFHINQAIVAGLVFGCGCAILGWYFSAARFYGLGLLSFLLGIIALFLPGHSGLAGIYFVLGGFGMGMAISGLFVLRRYLVENPLDLSHGE